MNIEGVVIFEAKSGIPLFSKLKPGIDSSLFSSFVTAVRHFSEDLALGGLSSVATDKNIIYLSTNSKTVTALITPASEEFQETLELAQEIGEQFEKEYDIPQRPQPHSFDDFKNHVDGVIKRVKNPFLNRVAEFAYKEYGGEVSRNAKLMKKSGAIGTVDIVLTHSEKVNTGENYTKEELAVIQLCRSFSFVRAVDDIAGRAQVLDFVDEIDSYGARMMKRNELEFCPYFPRRAVIVARDFGIDVPEYIDRLPKEDGKPFVDGSHVFSGISLKGTPKDVKCFLELWRWRENGAPEKLIG